LPQFQHSGTGVTGRHRAAFPRARRWAPERSGLDPGALVHRFPQLDGWERREASPTLKQLESFAKATHTPVGYLFLQ
jgi:hypothetical protein